MLRRYHLNFYEHEMLIERELCLFFTALLKTVNNMLRITLQAEPFLTVHMLCTEKRL